MGLSLRDQLLNAGFAAPKPAAEAKPTQPDRGRAAHSARRTGKPGADKAARSPKAASAPLSDEQLSLARAYAARAEAEKREREQAQRLAQEQAQRKREQRLRLSALVAGKSLISADAELARNFLYGKKIRKVMVTPEQLRELNTGALGVVQIDGRFLLLTAELVREVMQLAPQHVALFLPEGIGTSSTSEEEYADPRFQVPDDLVW